MKRQIKTTKYFDKKYKKFIERDFVLAKKVIDTLKRLAGDINDPILKTHKLSGDLKNSFACSINYEYRIVFYYDDVFVYLESIGSHDEVY